MNKYKIIIKNSLGEMDLEYWAEKEYKRILLIMKLIEESFSIDLNNYQQLRKSILDTSNYVRRLPSTISECVIIKDNRSDINNK